MLNLIVALAEEARPVVRHYRLKRLHHLHAFPVYGSDDIRLIVSGMGNLAAATATGYLAGIGDVKKSAAWLNIGIAGSNSVAVGEIVLAHKVMDVTRQQHFYPTLCFEVACKTATIETVAVPQINYVKGVVYDMEAAGFFSAAMRFSTTEMIHCLKIISDNNAGDVDNISAAGVVPLVEQRMDVISDVVGKLLEMINALAADNRGEQEMDFIRSRFYLTVSQQTQLNTLMQNWFALTDVSPLALLNIDTLKTSKALLHALQVKLDELPVKY